MLIKSLFNLETKSTANLPNEYFVMLEKEEKYKQLTEKLQKLNLFNRNFIDSASTIKTTLSELINCFFKQSEHLFLKKVQQAILSAYESMKKVCLNLNRTIQMRLFNYQSEIASLNKRYNQKLQQVMHYRKKVESIKKGPLQTRDDKERLERNMEKKRTIEEQCQRTQKLLVQNYQNFHSEVQKHLKRIPHQILVQFIEGNLLTHSKLTQLIEQQIPAIRNRRRQESIMSSAISDISDVQDIYILSEHSEDQSKSQDEIEIIIEPESAQTLKNISERGQIDKNYPTYGCQVNAQKRYMSPQGLFRRRNQRKSLIRKASIDEKIANKLNLVEKIKRIIQFESQHSSHSKNSITIELDKAFQKLQAPLSNQEKIHKIFNNIQNKYSGIDIKVNTKPTSKQQKLTLNIRDSAHEKSFVVQKEEFRNNHSPTRHKKNENTAPKKYLRNEQTLNNLPDENSSQSSTPKDQQSGQSLSEVIYKQKNINHQSQVYRKRNSEQIAQKSNFLTTNQLKQTSLSFQEFPNHLKKYEENILEQKDSVKQGSSNYLSTSSIQAKNQHKQKSFGLKKNQSKLGQEQKKRVVEHLFSVPALKDTKNQKNEINNDPNKKSLYMAPPKNKQTDPKFWFSTNFLTPKDCNNHPTTIKNNFTSNFKQQQQNSPHLRTKNSKSFTVQNKIDFSVFSNII